MTKLLSKTLGVYVVIEMVDGTGLRLLIRILEKSHLLVINTQLFSLVL